MPLARLFPDDSAQFVVVVADVLPHAHAVVFYFAGAGGAGKVVAARQRVALNGGRVLKEQNDVQAMLHGN